jgi:hypothetical protein
MPTFYSMIQDSRGLRIYILQEQSDPVIIAGTGVPSCRLLRLVMLWRSYSNPTPHVQLILKTVYLFLHKHSVRTSEETHYVFAIETSQLVNAV